MQTVKKIVHYVADHLPEQTTFDDAMYAWYVRQNLEARLSDFNKPRMARLHGSSIDGLLQSIPAAFPFKLLGRLLYLLRGYV